MVIQLQIPDKAVCISHNTNALEKKYESSYYPSIYGEIVGLFNLALATSLGEAKLRIQTCLSPLKKNKKTWHCVISCSSSKFGKCVYIYIYIYIYKTLEFHSVSGFWSLMASRTQECKQTDQTRKLPCSDLLSNTQVPPHVTKVAGPLTLLD